MGKAPVHKINCTFLDTKEIGSCECPRRLAAGTVLVMLQNLLEIFYDSGRGKIWDERSDTGNPAAAHCIKQYAKLIQEEQAAAHVIPKQTKPIFLGKLKEMVRI